MAMSSTEDRYLLPCGNDAAVLWEHVTAGTADGHERGCPHCLAAATGFRALREATGQLAGLDVAPRADLTERIMRAVRMERRRGTELPIATTSLGPIRITAQAAAVVLRFAADQADGVVARSCTVERIAGPADEPGAPHAVRLDIALRYGTDGPAAVGRVRRLVRAAAGDLAGLHAERIAITVVDTWREER